MEKRLFCWEYLWGLLALYMLCRYGFHIRSLNRENSRHRELEHQRQTQELRRDNQTNNKLNKKQLKFILQNPWHRVSESEPKEQYSNRVNVYLENGLYLANNNII